MIVKKIQIVQFESATHDYSQGVVRLSYLLKVEGGMQPQDFENFQTMILLDQKDEEMARKILSLKEEVRALEERKIALQQEVADKETEKVENHRFSLLEVD